MTLIEIYVVIVILIVILAILGHFSSKLNNTVLVLVLFLTVIAMCVGIVFVKLGVFLHTLYLM